MILGSLLGGVASIFTGTATGFLGAVAGGIIDYLKTKEANRQELLVLAAQKDLAITAANSATLLETIKLMAGSYDHDKAAYIGAEWPDKIRSMVRPMLIAALTTTSIYIALTCLLDAELDIVVKSEIARYSVFTCLDLTSMGISWYFGARQMEKINRNLAVAKKGK